MQYSNIIYKISFVENIKSNTLPFYYIGSKTNCKVIDNKIIYKRGKKENVYLTSGKISNKIMSIQNYTVEVLESDIDTINVIERECYWQKRFNAIESNEYSNLVYADGGNFTNPDFINIRKIGSNDIERVNKLNCDFEYVGATKDYVWIHKQDSHKTINKSELNCYIKDGWSIGMSEELKSKNYKKESNAFYGKRHKKSSIVKIKKSLNNFYQSTDGVEFRKRLSDNAKKRFKGIKPNQKTLDKAVKMTTISNKQNRTRYNIITNERVRLDKYASNNLMSQIWVTKEKYNIIKNDLYFTCIHCGYSTQSRMNINKWHNKNCKTIIGWKAWETEKDAFKMLVYANLDKYIEYEKLYGQKIKVVKILEILKPSNETEKRFASRMFNKIKKHNFDIDDVSWNKFKTEYERNINEN